MTKDEELNVFKKSMDAAARILDALARKEDDNEMCGEYTKSRLEYAADVIRSSAAEALRKNEH